MMLADVAKKYYLDGDYNCAESVLLAANEVYGFGLDAENCVKLVSAFGGGMGCGRLCGAVAGSMAALGFVSVTGRAHGTEGFKDLCAGTVAELEKALGSTECAQVKPAFFAEGTRCLAAVEAACGVLEKQMAALGKA